KAQAGQAACCIECQDTIKALKRAALLAQEAASSEQPPSHLQHLEEVSSQNLLFWEQGVLAVIAEGQSSTCWRDGMLQRWLATELDSQQAAPAVLDDASSKAAAVFQCPAWLNEVRNERVVRYDTTAFPFEELFQALFECSELAALHLQELSEKPVPLCPTLLRAYHAAGLKRPPSWKRAVMWQERRVKQFRRSEPYRRFIETYRRFIHQVVLPLVGCSEGLMYQSPPTLRCQMPSVVCMGSPHRDSDFSAHHGGEINFWMPVTRVWGSNTLHTESEPGKGDFHPLELSPGELVVFNGSQCLHYTEANRTDSTRVSFDFRVIPKSLIGDWRHTVSTGTVSELALYDFVSTKLLYCTKSLFIITDHPDFFSSNYQKGDEISFLGISRESGAAREGKDSPEGFRQKLATFAGGKLQPQPCWAVLGVLTASEEPFLLVVAEATKATDIGGEVVFEVARCDAFPFAEYASSEASASVTGVKLLLERNFYFSHDIDITRRLQTRTTGTGRSLSRCCGRVSERYFTPVMQGFVQLRGSALRLLLVAANWVETEMLAKVPSSMTGEPQATWLSFTQVRGSAPVFWEQASSNSCVTLGVTVTRGSGLAAAAFEKHQARLAEEFGDSLGKRETEGVLTDALKKAQARMHHGTHLVHLDFHARVTGEDRELSSIYTELAPSVEGFGFLEIADSKAGEELGKVKSRKYCTERPALQSLVFGGLFSALGDMMAPDGFRPEMQSVLRCMWADLGDVLSEQYTGAASTMGAALRLTAPTSRTVHGKLPLTLCSVAIGFPKPRALWKCDGPPVASCPSQLSHGIFMEGRAGNLARCCVISFVVVVFAFQEFAELTPANVVMLGSGDEAATTTATMRTQTTITTTTTTTTAANITITTAAITATTKTTTTTATIIEAAAATTTTTTATTTTTMLVSGDEATTTTKTTTTATTTIAKITTTTTTTTTRPGKRDSTPLPSRPCRTPQA
ncbi:unnamed protein product, partial [Polarella glacialis]